LSYFVQLGRTAYSNISLEKEVLNPSEALFHTLCQEFTHMMTLLQAMRDPLQAIDLLQSYELWQDLGNQQAFERLCKSTQALPYVVSSKKFMN
jgi:hypothetical protein